MYHNYLFELPPEILVNILCNLPLADFASLREIHSIFDECLSSSLRLQHHHLCETAGVHDNPKCGLVLRERFEQLRDHEKAWTRGKIVRSRQISAFNSSSGRKILHHQSGIIILADMNTTDGRIRHLRLLANSTDEVRWTDIDIGNGMRLLSTDIHGSDLLAVLTLRPNTVEPLNHDCYIAEVKLLQFSTGEAHPLAANPTIVISNNLLSTFDLALIFGIIGECLILTVCDEAAETEDICFLNWKTGVMLLKHPVRYFAYSWMTVLSSSFVLFTDLSLSCFEIWPIPSPTPSDTAVLGPLLVLHLPTLREDCSYSEINLCSGSESAVDSGDCRRPFRMASESSVIAVSLFVTTGDEWNFFFQLVIDRGGILSLCNHLSLKHLSWDEWGPSISRWLVMAEGKLPVSLSGSYGNRFVYLPPREWLCDKVALVVLDFNSSAEDEDNSDPTRVFSDSIDYLDHQVFEGPVKNHLRYSQVQLSLEVDLSSEISSTGDLFIDGSLLAIVTPSLGREYDAVKVLFLDEN
ncbi:hypothetical protein H0H93_006972 [Arthromyces matolae]|nr:hypothetical protein H0H93_006972 [Arthromyces matolae]